MLCSGLLLSVLLSTTFAASINLKQVPDTNYCYAEDDNPYLYFATKTSYGFINGADFNQYIIPNCKPVQFWGFNRHGTRLPSVFSIKELRTLDSVKEQVLNNYRNQVPNSKVRLCEKDLDLLGSWKWNTSITDDTENTLTSQGWEELKQMAIRYKKWYPELLDVPYSKKHFEFIWTSTERTKSSFQAYAQGLFGNEYMQVEGHVNDTLLRAYKTCKKWRETVDVNPDTYMEVIKFFNSPVVQNVLSEVSARLGFKTALNIVLVGSIYNMCRYEQAWNPHKKSAWCSAFTKEHLEIIEYAEDISYYVNNGYLNEMNSKVGCLPLKDLMEKLENAIIGYNDQPKVSVYFTHSSALQLLMNALTMNKDDLPLKADNMEQQKYRMWRISFMIPFAANLNAVLYKCDKGDENRIMFLLNEKRVYYPGCHEGVCSWEFLKHKLLTVVRNCNLDFCNE